MAKNSRKWLKIVKISKNVLFNAISSGITLVIGPKVGLNILCNDDNRNTDTKYYHRDSKLG